MDSFDLRNFLIENKLTSNSKSLSEQEVEEGLLGKGLLAGLLMTAGLSWGQIKPEYKAKIDSIQKVQTLSPQQKRAEIQKIVQLNRDEISGKKEKTSYVQWQLLVLQTKKNIKSIWLKMLRKKM
jgi:hypothetical protein